MSKTKRAENIIRREITKHRRSQPFRLNHIHRRYRDTLPITFATWNLVTAGELRRTRQRGFYLRG